MKRAIQAGKGSSVAGLVVGPVLLSALNACANGRPGDGVPPRVTSVPCDESGSHPGLRCGFVAVPEDRATPGGREITVWFGVASATGAPAEPDPLFLIPGGPGLGLSSRIDDVLELWKGVRSTRDLVLVDPRGAGLSGRLDCRLLPGDPDRAATFLQNPLAPDVVAACRDLLAEGADLGAYTTTAQAEDLDAVRTALGYRRINLYGVSYGSLTAQEYLRRHEAHVRTVVLQGPVPPSGDRLLTVPLRTDSLVVRHVEDCLSRATCTQAYPDLDVSLASVLARDSRDTVEVQWDDTASGQAETLGVPRRYFGELIQILLYRSEDAAELPAVLSLLAANRLTPLLDALVRVRRGLYTGDLAWGQYLSVYCSDLLPVQFPERALADARRTLIGDGEIADLRAACETWPVTPAPSGFRAPVFSDVPTLIITGELDPVTPPDGGDFIAARLANSRHLVLRGSGHELAADVWQTCASGMMEAFLRTADVRDLENVAGDATCDRTPN